MPILIRYDDPALAMNLASAVGRFRTDRELNAENLRNQQVQMQQSAILARDVAAGRARDAAKGSDFGGLNWNNNQNSPPILPPANPYEQEYQSALKGGKLGSQQFAQEKFDATQTAAAERNRLAQEKLDDAAAVQENSAGSVSDLVDQWTWDNALGDPEAALATRDEMRKRIQAGDAKGVLKDISSLRDKEKQVSGNLENWSNYTDSVAGTDGEISPEADAFVQSSLASGAKNPLDELAKFNRDQRAGKSMSLRQQSVDQAAERYQAQLDRSQASDQLKAQAQPLINQLRAAQARERTAMLVYDTATAAAAKAEAEGLSQKLDEAYRRFGGLPNPTTQPAATTQPSLMNAPIWTQAQPAPTPISGGTDQIETDPSKWDSYLVLARGDSNQAMRLAQMDGYEVMPRAEPNLPPLLIIPKRGLPSPEFRPSASATPPTPPAPDASVFRYAVGQEKTKNGQTYVFRDGSSGMGWYRK